jgi:DnaJ-domain-containing protein 1
VEPEIAQRYIDLHAASKRTIVVFAFQGSMAKINLQTLYVLGKLMTMMVN